MTRAHFITHVLALGFAALPQLVFAQAQIDASPESAAREHARIAAERSQASATFAQEEKACYAKFAVTDCLTDVRRRQRVVMADLKRQEVSLNDAERKRKAAEQASRLEQRNDSKREESAEAKMQSSLRSQQEREQRAAGKSADRAAAQSAEAMNRESFEARKQSSAAKQLARDEKASQAAQERQRFETKQVEAEENRKRRETSRQNSGKPKAQPLPVPTN
jgi:colicin import membrane protein